MLCSINFPVAKKFMDKRGGEYQDFPSKFFLSQCPKITWGTLQFFTNFGYRKFYMLKRFTSRLSVDSFLSHSTEKLRSANLCLTKFLVSKKFMDKKGGGRKEGVSPFSIKRILSLSTETFGGEPFCF